MRNTLENFHIYKETRANNKVKDKGIFRQNVIFDTILRRDAVREQPAQQ